MTEINNLKELEEYGELKIFDKVSFHINKDIIKYEVKTLIGSAYLCNNHGMGSSNCIIFDVLDIDKYETAERIYRYKALNASDINKVWPEARDGDFPALTKLVKELYLIIEEKEVKYTKYNRFEIMDI